MGPASEAASDGGLAVDVSADGVFDIHSHAMPLPLLEWLAERELADVTGVPSGIVKLDTRVSGVGPGAPLPLALSQYDVGTRLTEMDQMGVWRHAVSLPPFLFCTTADDEAFATGIVRRGNDELPSTSLRRRSDCSGSAMYRSAGRASPRRPAVRWTTSAWPASRSAARVAARTSTIR